MKNIMSNNISNQKKCDILKITSSNKTNKGTKKIKSNQKNQ